MRFLEVTLVLSAAAALVLTGATIVLQKSRMRPLPWTAGSVR